MTTNPDLLPLSALPFFTTGPLPSPPERPKVAALTGYTTPWTANLENVMLTALNLAYGGQRIVRNVLANGMT